LIGEGRHEEGRCGSTPITPGMLIKLDSDGRYIPNDGSDPSEKLFALEDALQGRTINDAYAEDELVAIGVQHAGDVVYAMLDEGENASIGSFLQSAGNGSLAVSTTNPVAVALEALDLSASDSEGVRIRVRIL